MAKAEKQTLKLEIEKRQGAEELCKEEQPAREGKV